MRFDLRVACKSWISAIHNIEMMWIIWVISQVEKKDCFCSFFFVGNWSECITTNDTCMFIAVRHSYAWVHVGHLPRTIIIINRNTTDKKTSERLDWKPHRICLRQSLRFVYCLQMILLHFLYRLGVMVESLNLL